VTRVSSSLRRAPGAFLGLLASAVGLASVIVAAILVLYIVLVGFKANPANVIVRDVRHVARPLAWDFKNLFTPHSYPLRVLVNYGIAALVYLAAGRLIVRILRVGGGSG
jgi:hypothetical protein